VAAWSGMWKLTLDPGSEIVLLKCEHSARSFASHSLTHEGDGEATFLYANNFTVKSTGVSTIGGKTRTSSTTRIGKWLGTDCGELKPMEAPR
jgi:hypothetical protein